MTFLSDSFTDTAGTTLASHSPEVGGAWSKHTSSGSANASIDATGGRLQSDAATTSIPTYQNAATPPAADYVVRATVTRTAAATGTQAAGVMLRAVNGVNSYYLADYDANSGAGRWRLRKTVSGTNTTLGTASATLTQDQAYLLEAVVIGDQLTLRVDGSVVVGPITDSALAAAGLVGVRLGGTNVFRLDDVQAAGVLYTGSGSASLPALTASGEGAFVGAAYTGAGAAALPALSAAGAGTHTPPAYVGSGSPALPALSAAGTGTHTPPAYVGSGSPALPPLTGSGAGIYGGVLYTGAGAADLHPLVGEGAGAFLAPVYAGLGLADLPALVAEGAGTFTAGAAILIDGRVLTLPARQRTIVLPARGRLIRLPARVRRITLPRRDQ
jgi:hypothetical protein